MRIAPPVQRSLRLSILEGSAWSVYWGIVTGAVMNGLFLAMGARPVQLAVLNALPLLSQVCGVFAARLLQARDVRKPLVLMAEGVSRSLWLLFPLLLLMPAGAPGRVWFALAVATLSHVVHSAGAVGWLSWISDLVPEEIRGLYFGLRNAVLGLVGVAGVTVVSRWADAAKEAAGSPEGYLGTLLTIVGLGVGFAALSWVGLLAQPVRKAKRFARVGWGALWDALRDPSGRRIAVSWTAVIFSAGLTTGIYLPFFLGRLGMSYTGIAVYGWIFVVVSTLAAPLVGRLGDRFGHRRLLVVAWLGVFWQPMLSVFTPDSMPHLLGLIPWTILLDAVAGGCFWPAMNLAQTNLVIGQARSEDRAALFATLSATAGLAGFLAAMAGGAIADLAGEGWSADLAGIPLDDLRLPLFLGACLRLLAGAAVLAVREPPRDRAPVTGGQAFGAVWRLIVGKPGRVGTR